MPRHKEVAEKTVECERCGRETVVRQEDRKERATPNGDWLCILCGEDRAYLAEIRLKAIRLGLCDETTAGMLERDELEPMIEGLEKEGLNVNDAPLSMDPKVIIKEMLDIIAIRNALQLPMDTACQRCAMMPMHLAKDCVCRRARAYVKEHDV